MLKSPVTPFLAMYAMCFWCGPVCPSLIWFVSWRGGWRCRLARSSFRGLPCRQVRGVRPVECRTMVTDCAVSSAGAAYLASNCGFSQEPAGRAGGFCPWLDKSERLIKFYKLRYSAIDPWEFVQIRILIENGKPTTIVDDQTGMLCCS